MKQSIQVDIGAAPDKVFHWLDDAERLKEWVVGVVENEELEKKDGYVGSTFRQVYEENGKLMEFQGVVTSYEKDRRLGVHMTGQFFDLDAEYELQPTGGGTRLTQSSSVQFKGAWKVMGLLMAPFMKKAGCKKLEEDFGRLKVLCESS